MSQNEWSEIDSSASREGTALIRALHNRVVAFATAKGIGVHSTSRGVSRGHASRPASGRFADLAQHLRTGV